MGTREGLDSIAVVFSRSFPYACPHAKKSVLMLHPRFLAATICKKARAGVPSPRLSLFAAHSMPIAPTK